MSSHWHCGQWWLVAHALMIWRWFHKQTLNIRLDKSQEAWSTINQTRETNYISGCKINFYDNKIKDDLNSICLVVGWVDCWRDNKNSRLHDALLHCLNECQDNDSDSTNYGTVSLSAAGCLLMYEVMERPGNITLLINEFWRSKLHETEQSRIH